MPVRHLDFLTTLLEAAKGLVMFHRFMLTFVCRPSVDAVVSPLRVCIAAAVHLVLHSGEFLT